MKQVEPRDMCYSNSHLQIHKGDPREKVYLCILSGTRRLNWVHQSLFDISLVILFTGSSSLIDLSEMAHENNTARILACGQ